MTYRGQCSRKCSLFSSPLPQRPRGYSRSKVIVGSECWSRPQTLKYTIFFFEFGTPKIYQQVLRFLDNFAICGLVGSIHIFENSLLTPDIWGKYCPSDHFRIIKRVDWFLTYCIGAMPKTYSSYQLRFYKKGEKLALWFSSSDDWMSSSFHYDWLFSNISKKRVSPTTNNNHFADETDPYKHKFTTDRDPYEIVILILI